MKEYIIYDGEEPVALQVIYSKRKSLGLQVKSDGAVTVRVPQLSDCKHHLNLAKDAGHDSMIFIVEGKSAAGTFINSRDPAYQAVFTLRGKPLNAEKKRLEQVLQKKNQNLMLY